jgi:hypothetical protein
MFVCLYYVHAEIVTIFGSKMVTISARNTNTDIQNMQTSQGYINITTFLNQTLQLY